MAIGKTEIFLIVILLMDITEILITEFCGEINGETVDQYLQQIDNNIGNLSIAIINRVHAYHLQKYEDLCRIYKYRIDHTIRDVIMNIDPKFINEETINDYLFSLFDYTGTPLFYPEKYASYYDVFRRICIEGNRPFIEFMKFLYDYTYGNSAVLLGRVLFFYSDYCKEDGDPELFFNKMGHRFIDTEDIEKYPYPYAF